MDLLTAEAAHLVYDSIIVSALKYNCIVNLNLNSSQQSKLKSLQRRAESLFNVKTTPIMNTFNKHAVMLVKKCLCGNVAPAFVGYFKLRDCGVNTRNNRISVDLPYVKLSFARNSFYFMGAKLFNSLPLSLRQADSISSFKKQTKLHFE